MLPECRNCKINLSFLLLFFIVLIFSAGILCCKVETRVNRMYLGSKNKSKHKQFIQINGQGINSRIGEACSHKRSWMFRKIGRFSQVPMCVLWLSNLLLRTETRSPGTCRAVTCENSVGIVCTWSSTKFRRQKNSALHYAKLFFPYNCYKNVMNLKRKI